ncbi:MAG TPA: glycosyltransferase [Pyrinomonadaceae bacterium]|jgi:mannosyltransferase OCH1-like enzyme|nr:glycosyltransferase [Pyrinomonadaceae bacterium]
MSSTSPPTLLSGLNKTVQGLWIGPALSAMEQLSIASFLQHGHQYHLYVYEDVKNIPAGTVVRDAGEILPASSIFQYPRSPSYAGFANFFRYKLLLDRGGWWVDTDTICLRTFDFADEYVFSSQTNERRSESANCGIIKAPPGSEAMAYAFKVCQTKDPARLVWGETGPRLMAKLVRKFSLEQYLKTHHVFCPVAYQEWRDVLRPGVGKLLDDRTYAIHLWNEMWRAAGQDKNAQYHPSCLYETLKRTYLPTVSAAGAPA